MKTNQSIKALIVAIIISALSVPNTVKAYSLKKTQMLNLTHNITFEENTNIENLEIKPINAKLHSNINEVKFEINVDELRQIKTARKKALELEKQKQEEERKKQEEERLAQEKAKAEEAINNITYTSNTSLSYDELVEKINRSLNSDLTGKGETFVKYAANLGIDPYLAVAIVLHETGCEWTCSTLLKQCNNVGGMKGSPGCNGGSYKSFNSLDEGIEAFMNNLYNNYISQGLTTPEQIGPKYAASTTWASQVRTYMNKISY